MERLAYEWRIIRRTVQRSIKDGVEEWDTWDAYSWTVHDPGRRQGVPLPTICGAKVRYRSPVPEDPYTAILPASNPVVIGKRPGEILRSKVRTDIHGDYCAEFIPFEPVWALPTEPYHSDKKIARVVLVGEARHVQRLRKDRRTNPDERARIIEWYSAVLAAGRKGLRTEPDSSEVTALWKDYKRQAKTLWQKKAFPDDLNRIRLAMRTLVAIDESARRRDDTATPRGV